MADDKGLNLSFIMLLVTALIIVLVLKGVQGLLSLTRMADMSEEATLVRIQPIGQLNTGEPIVAAA
ncbi:MAG: hypothetical protein WC012_11440, partial [Thiohalomonadaceae bacterium]